MTNSATQILEGNIVSTDTQVVSERETPLELNGTAEYSIDSIEDLLVLLNRLYKTDEKILWFRGQADYSWGLSPGFFRTRGQVSESTLLMKFKQSASQLVMGAPRESFDWMFLMQHYGLPTRLLDWSESPLVGLYFAVENTLEYDKDGVLWIMNPMKLNLLSRIHNTDEDTFIPSFDDEVLESYTIENLKSGHRNLRLLPLAILAARNNPRIQAQLGVFTVHHTASEGIENIERQHAHFMKVRISREAKVNLKKQLSILGYSRFQIFPELASIADVIKESMS